MCKQNISAFNVQILPRCISIHIFWFVDRIVQKFLNTFYVDCATAVEYIFSVTGSPREKPYFCAKNQQDTQNQSHLY